MVYRKYLLIAINAIIILWLIKITYFPKIGTDFFGIFFIFVIIFLIIYNLYALFLYKFYPINKQHNILIEFLFIILLLIPFFLVWYFTS